MSHIWIYCSPDPLKPCIAMKNIIISLILVVSLLVVLYMLFRLCQNKSERSVKLSLWDKVKLSACGIIAFVSDTVGIGSFAPTIAICKLFKLIPDEGIPGTVNSAQIIPGALEAILFLQVVHVDYLTLSVLVLGCCIGGVLGGMVVSKLKVERTQLLMAVSFVLMALVILANQLHWLPLGGQALVLSHWKLVIGFFGMIVCGFLPSLGVGLFAVVEILLFLLGLSPLVAFPIMTTAGALQQPLTGSAFIYHGKVPLKKMLIISLAGVLGVMITVPFVAHLSLEKLRWLLLAIVIYNAVTLGYSYYRYRLRPALRVVHI